MSVEGWQALTAAFVALNTLFLLMAAIYAREAKATAERAEATAVLTKEAALRTETVATQTMKNTNHLTEALVATTAVAAHATGKEEGRVEGENKAAVLAATQTEDSTPAASAP